MCRRYSRRVATAHRVCLLLWQNPKCELEFTQPFARFDARMNSLVKCPGCGFCGRLPDGLSALTSIVCPQCRRTVPLDQLRHGAVPVDDVSCPIFVDSTPSHTPTSVSVSMPTPAPAPAPALAPRSTTAPTPPPRPAPAAPATEPEPYSGAFMKDEAERFAQYVAERLGELHRKRIELAEAENRFEAMAMGHKQEFHRARAATAAEVDRFRELEAAVLAKEAGLVAREAALAARESEVAARESRVARAESRAAEADRRTAELRAAIDQLDARRAALTEEREILNRRAEQLDRAELAQHRRAAELDELDERLRLEQEEFEREREEAHGHVG